MPLGRSRRRRDRPSYGDSTKDALYDQLLNSLTQGAEPMAAEEEYHDWMHQWFTTHPGRSVEEPDAPGGRRWEDGPYPPLAAMPWPIQRRWALTMLICFNWDFVLRFWRVRREIEEADGKRRGSANSATSGN